MPIGWAAGIGAAATVYSAYSASESAGDAADQQAQSSAAGIEEQRRQYDQTTAEQRRLSDQTRADFAPYREAGTQALGRYQTEINGNTSASDALNEPGYQFGLQQGQLGLDRKAASAGGRVSGAALKAASEYATNYATTGYNAAYQRRQDRLNRLASLAGIGQSATGSSAAAGADASGNIMRAGMNSANNISGMMTAQGNAAGAASLAQGNIWGGAVNQLGAIGQRWAGQPKQTGWGSTSDAQGLNVSLG